MNTRKTTLLLLGICLFLLFFTGCYSEEDQAVRKAVEDELNPLSSSDAETIQECISTQALLPSAEDTDMLSEDITEIFRLFYKDFSFQVKKITRKENRAIARTELTTINARALAKDFTAAALEKNIEQDANPSQVAFSLKDSYLLLKNLLAEKDYKTSTQSAEIELTKKGETWHVLHTAELDQLLTGDFLSYVTDSNLLSPMEIVEAHFHAIKNFDSEQLKIYLSLDELLNTDAEYNSSIAHIIADQIQTFFDYEITGEALEDASATVTATITSVDFSSIIQNYQAQMTEWLKTSESLAVGSSGRRQKERDVLLACMESNQTSTSHEITIQLFNDGVNWKIQMDSEIAQAVLGDVQEAMNSISKEIQ